MTNPDHPITIGGVQTDENANGRGLCGSEEDDEETYLVREEVRILERRVAMLEMEGIILREIVATVRESAVSMAPAVWQCHGLEKVRHLLSSSTAMEREVVLRLEALERDQGGAA